jgi:hypothetical protein
VKGSIQLLMRQKAFAVGSAAIAGASKSDTKATMMLLTYTYSDLATRNPFPGYRTLVS